MVMWTYVGIISLMSLFTYEVDALSCTMCWAVDGTLGKTNAKSAEDQIINQLHNLTGVDTRGYETDGCKTGNGNDYVKSTDDEYCGVFECDGMCTKRKFELVDFDVTFYQRTCMTQAHLSHQKCIEYEENPDLGTAHGLNMVVTATCCDDDDCCNSAPGLNLHLPKILFMTMIVFHIISKF